MSVKFPQTRTHDLDEIQPGKQGIPRSWPAIKDAAPSCRFVEDPRALELFSLGSKVKGLGSLDD